MHSVCFPAFSVVYCVSMEIMYRVFTGEVFGSVNYFFHINPFINSYMDKAKIRGLVRKSADRA